MIKIEKLSQENLPYELKKLDKDNLVKLLLLQVRNVWRVDGLYFLGIEKRFGVEAATEIDREAWRTLAKIEAKDLIKTFGVEKIDTIYNFMELLKRTGWALYQNEVKIEYLNDKEAVFKVTKCKIQETRLKKGLNIFPCKPVRLGYLEEFVRTINENIDVKVIKCPPDDKEPEYWCGWRFKIKE